MMWIWLIFAVVFGACVGSFLNVVIYRLPEGRSIVWPPSSCPKCGHRLAWFDNVPVLGWAWLGGKCRYCAAPISAQYPLVEAAMGALAGLLFTVCYLTDLRPDFSGPPGAATAPIFLAYVLLTAGLLAATIIDARLFIIPLSIPWSVAAAGLVLILGAVVVHPEARVEVAVPPATPYLTRGERLAAVTEPYGGSSAVAAAVERWPGESAGVGSVEIYAAPLVASRLAAAGIGGAAGLALAIGLLWRGVLPQSFAEEHPGNASSNPKDWVAHPHPRREMLKEILFVSLPAIGAAIGAGMVGPEAAWPVAGRVVGGMAWGMLAGGGVVWLVRILGTLGFGKEAMGLGDVHLMAAVGAVCGWQTAVLAFFIAPFFGLAWAGVSFGVGRLMRHQFEPIPYGPHLAIGSLLVMLFREPLLIRLGLHLWIA
jgi:leader peptidase (prepilin peptidase)/N-methyltransferase